MSSLRDKQLIHVLFVILFLSFLDGSAITLSSASIISEASMIDLLRRAAPKLLRLEHFLSQLPQKPGVCWATSFNNTVRQRFIFSTHELSRLLQ